MKHFKLTSTLLIVGLLILLGYNIQCLINLYKSISAQTHEMVVQSLKDADLDEVLNRPQKYSLPDSTTRHNSKVMSQQRNILGDTLYVTITDETTREVVEVRKIPLPSGTNYSDIMISEIGYGAHQTIDEFFPLHIADVDSLFRLSMHRKGLIPDFASVVRISPEGRITAGDPSLSENTKLESVAIIYNTMTGESYRAYYSPLDKFIFRQMSGIILSTFAIIVILTIAFWYLFHTISSLRTIEEMKDDFVSNMTHELKTPIAIAYSANDALLNYDMAKDPTKNHTYLKIANKQLKRLGELVENILAVSMERRKNMKLNIEKALLKPLIEEIATAHRMRTDKDITIDIDGEEGVVIEIDKSHMANILNNLIDNAIKYSGDSVKINIKYDTTGISVIDNGPGIPSKSIPFLFNKFYRVPHGNRQDVRGYGIGLYYVSNIIQKMGWTIDVKSKYGEGSVFTIKFEKNEA